MRSVQAEARNAAREFFESKGMRFELEEEGKFLANGDDKIDQPGWIISLVNVVRYWF